MLVDMSKVYIVKALLCKMYFSSSILNHFLLNFNYHHVSFLFLFSYNSKSIFIRFDSCVKSFSQKNILKCICVCFISFKHIYISGNGFFENIMLLC